MESQGGYKLFPQKTGVDEEAYKKLRDCLAGDSFTTGDVLLEIETDKAQMDVEAQDDGKMAKITVLRRSDKDWSHLLRIIEL